MERRARDPPVMMFGSLKLPAALYARQKTRSRIEVYRYTTRKHSVIEYSRGVPTRMGKTPYGDMTLYNTSLVSGHFDSRK